MSSSQRDGRLCVLDGSIYHSTGKQHIQLLDAIRVLIQYEEAQEFVLVVSSSIIFLTALR